MKVRIALLFAVILATSTFVGAAGQDDPLRSPREGDILYGPLGPERVNHVGDGSYITTFLQDTCLGDLVEKGVIPDIVLPSPVGDGSEILHTGSCGTRPITPDVVYAPHHPGFIPLETDSDVQSSQIGTSPNCETLSSRRGEVRAAQFPNQQSWQVGATSSSTEIYTDFSFFKLNGQEFNVTGDYAELLWAGGYFYNQYLQSRGNPFSFGQAMIIQAGSSFSSGSFSHPIFASQFEDQTPNSELWCPIITDSGATPVSLTRWNAVGLMLIPGTPNTPADANRWIAFASNDDGQSLHLLPESFLQPGLYSGGTNIVPTSWITTPIVSVEQTNVGSGTRPSLNTPVFSYGIFEQQQVGGIISFAPHVTFAVSKEPGTPGSVCPPLSRVYVPPEWAALTNTSGNYCPTGQVW